MELLQEPVEKKQTFPLTFQHKNNSFSLYDTHDSKSQCRDKKLQLVGCEKALSEKKKQIIAVTQEIFKKASSAFCPHRRNPEIKMSV